MAHSSKFEFIAPNDARLDPPLAGAEANRRREPRKGAGTRGGDYIYSYGELVGRSGARALFAYDYMGRDLLKGRK